MYSNVSQTRSMKINSHSNTACSSRVFQQPTRLILTDVCKQSTVQPVQLSSTSQIHTDLEQLSDSSFFFFSSSFTTDPCDPYFPSVPQTTNVIFYDEANPDTNIATSLHCWLRKIIQDPIMLKKKEEESRR